MFLIIILPLLAIIANSWTYEIYHSSVFLGTLLVAQTIIFYLAVLKKKNKILYTLIFVLFALYTLINIKDFDLSTVRKAGTSPELQVIEQRQLYYKTELNWYYWNKYGKKYFDNIKPALDKYTIRLNSGMDLSLYFGDYRIILFPLFGAGLVFLLKNSNGHIFAFFLLSFFIQGLFQLRDGSAHFFYYPFINSTIALGVYMFLKRNEKI
jgi:hypothetical protein